MNINNNFTPLAWHEGDRELQSNRATYAYGHIVPLLAHNQSLLPFQIITATGAVDMQSYVVRIYTPDGVLVRDNVAMPLVKVEFDNYDVIIYNGGTISPDLPNGQYYLTLSSGGSTWYSDVVTVVASVLGLTKIEWWDENDFVFGAGRIVYKYEIGEETVQYRNRMYFLEEIGMPEYVNEEEGETRDGLFYATRLLSGKKYNLRVVQASETMCDALRFVHLSDNVEVRDGYGRVYYCDSVLVTPEWVGGGAVASLAIEITTDTFVKQLGGYYFEDTPIVDEGTGVIGEGVIGDTFVIGV